VLTDTSSDAEAERVVVPDTVEPLDGWTTDVTGGVVSSPNAYNLWSSEPT
jgi:hypothetical protein